MAGGLKKKWGPLYLANMKTMKGTTLQFNIVQK